MLAVSAPATGEALPVIQCSPSVVFRRKDIQGIFEIRFTAVEEADERGPSACSHTAGFEGRAQRGDSLVVAEVHRLLRGVWAHAVRSELGETRV